MGVLHAHSIRDEPHIQRNASGEVATGLNPIICEGDVDDTHHLLVLCLHKLFYIPCKCQVSSGKSTKNKCQMLKT